VIQEPKFLSNYKLGEFNYLSGELNIRWMNYSLERRSNLDVMMVSIVMYQAGAGISLRC